MRYTPEQAYAEDCKRRPLYDDGVQRATWDALSAIAKESWRRNPTPREWRLRDADGERLHACIMLAETDSDFDDETETGEDETETGEDETETGEDETETGEDEA